MEQIGFIILRHVKNENTAKYWIHSYESLRKYYTENKILIIDDNSDYNYIDLIYQKSLYNTTILRSEYPGRGELLPYYYFLLNNFCDKVVIIHDSVFFNSFIDFSTINNYAMFWYFSHHYNIPSDEKRLISKLNNSEELLELYNDTNKWVGCFGAMAVITYNYLQLLNAKYNFENLLPHIKTRIDRQAFERVIACMLQKNNNTQIIFTHINFYCRWGISYDDMINNKEEVNHLPIIKIWTGR